MSRTKAITGTELIPTNQFSLPMEQLKLSEAQLETFARNEKRLAQAAAMLARLERDERALKSKIDASEDAKKLKEIKQQRRVMKQIEFEVSAAYNGAIDLALSEVQGNSLQEKIRNLKQNRLEAAI